MAHCSADAIFDEREYSFMTWITTIGVHLRELWEFRHEPEHLRRLADLYWSTLLVLSAGTIVAGGLYGGAQFFAALGGGGQTAAPSSGDRDVLLNSAHLKETLEGFAARRADYELFKKSPPPIADPSR